MQGQIPAKVRALVRESLKPEIPGETLKTLGFHTSLPDEQQKVFVNVMVLNGQDTEEVWVGYRNFYVITRYNHSRLYAMAVFQLAEQLAEVIDENASGAYDES
jgi:membrane-bound lytic murein transglycosylase B